MSKAVISNRIYLNCEAGSELYNKLVKELTYEISQQPVSPYPLIIQNIINVSDRVVSIPAGRTDLIPEDYVIVDKRCYVTTSMSPPAFIPRGSQADAIDTISSAGMGLINAPVGWGKSIAGLGIAYELQQKTLIITTTTTIRDMWIGEVNKWFDFKCGVIGGGKFDIDSPIVVGNIQTIRNRMDQLKDEFGTIIIDEVHRSPAKTFTDTLNTLKARHKFGLSGTMVRKDGLHCVLQDYFGTDMFVGTVENVMAPTVHLWDSKMELSANEFIPWANKITQLMESPRYKAEVLTLCNLYADAGHKVLVLCDRTSMLEYLHEETKDRSLIITGKVTGATIRQEIMDIIADAESGADILFAIQSIFSEGVSLNELSAVILATPINNEPLLVQIIGRIMREAEGKLDPVVVDIQMKGNTGKRHRNSRRKTYIEKGWAITDMKKILS